jgi:hypothetical protein
LKLELKNSLSVKLLRVVLLSALIVGVVLSCAQIVFDAYKTRQAVAGDAQRILDMFRDPSTQAVYSLDRNGHAGDRRPVPGRRCAHGLHRPSQRNHARAKIP